jgi:hypothetical protein
VVATYEGYLSLAKSAQAPGLIQAGIRQLKQYLEGLRA